MIRHTITHCYSCGAQAVKMPVTYYHQKYTACTSCVLLWFTFDAVPRLTEFGVVWVGIPESARGPHTAKTVIGMYKEVDHE